MPSILPGGPGGGPPPEMAGGAQPMPGGPPGEQGPTLADLMNILTQLPEEVKQVIIAKLSEPEQAGPPPGVAGAPPGGAGVPAGPPAEALRGAAMARTARG
jgi:hypothetical protein